MKCPACKVEGFRYVIKAKPVGSREKHRAPRTNWQMHCNDCGHEGEYK